MHYDHFTELTVGSEASALANYYKCLEVDDSYVNMQMWELVVWEVDFKTPLELKYMKYDKAINGPDGEAWAKEIKRVHDIMMKNDAWAGKR